MKTKILNINIDWTEIKNRCRNTVNKEPTNNEPSSEFKTKLLISEHSPIRLGTILFSWKGIKSWISVHFARHWLGWDKWVSTQRSDRTGNDRDSAPQDAPVNMDINANCQAVINVGRYRLCYQASPETREYMEDFKMTVRNFQKEVSDVIVPNCIYRGACPEFQMCQERFWAKFLEWCKENGKTINTIAQRYEAYNEYFYESRKADTN